LTATGSQRDRKSLRPLPRPPRRETGYGLFGFGRRNILLLHFGPLGHHFDLHPAILGLAGLGLVVGYGVCGAFAGSLDGPAGNALVHQDLEWLAQVGGTHTGAQVRGDGVAVRVEVEQGGDVEVGFGGGIAGVPGLQLRAGAPPNMQTA